MHRQRFFGPILILMAICLACACETDDETTETTLDGCVAATPCVVVAQAYADEVVLTPIQPMENLGVFDANQGGIATWLTIILANAPSENPKIQVDIMEGGMQINSPLFLKVPFKDGPGGIRFRDGFMVQLNEPCCASDFEGREVTVTVRVFFDDMEPFSTTVPVILTEVAWPL